MLIPVAIQVTSQSRGQLLAGKLLGGIPQGIFVVSAANYIGEATTIRLRGPLSAMLTLVLLAGVVFGLTVGYEQFGEVTSDWMSWRLVLAIQ
jgi:MFS family permease